MSDTVYEIEVRIRSASDEAVRHLEGPVEGGSAESVAAEVVKHLSDRSGGRIKHVPGTDR